MDFLLRLRPKKGIEPIRSLRRALKYLLRSCGLRALSIQEIPENGNASQRAFVGNSNSEQSSHE
jgi:hypothetical protein